MHTHDVTHTWQPSPRLRKLMERTGAIPQELPGSADAVAWLFAHKALFSSPALATRVITIVRYRLAGEGYTLAQLQRDVADSWIENGRVKGALFYVRNLGVVTFNELKRVLGV